MTLKYKAQLKIYHLRVFQPQKRTMAAAYFVLQTTRASVPNSCFKTFSLIFKIDHLIVFQPQKRIMVTCFAVQTKSECVSENHGWNMFLFCHYLQYIFLTLDTGCCPSTFVNVLVLQKLHLV